jgi:hypothetical protein
MQSCNVGIRLIPRPFTYESTDDESRSKTVIETYGEETFKKLNSIIEDTIDDSMSQAETD